MADPAHGDTDDRAANDGQVKRGGAVLDAAAVFSSNNVQSLVEAVFDAPIVAIRAEHLLGVHLRHRTRSNQELCLGYFGWFAGELNRAGELGGLLGEGKLDAGGADLKSPQATFLGPATIDFRSLGAGSCVLRGKRRATDWNKAAARF
jgi:hypothetical protein